jgi:hypothetical protein
MANKGRLSPHKTPPTMPKPAFTNHNPFVSKTENRQVYPKNQ